MWLGEVIKVSFAWSACETRWGVQVRTGKRRKCSKRGTHKERWGVECCVASLIKVKSAWGMQEPESVCTGEGACGERGACPLRGRREERGRQIMKGGMRT